MPQEITTADQGTLIIPGAYPSIQVQSVPVGVGQLTLKVDELTVGGTRSHS